MKQLASNVNVRQIQASYSYVMKILK